MADVDWQFNVRRRFSWFVDYFQIVGTKNATKVLKDGDKVEVDAGEGVVRKL